MWAIEAPNFRCPEALGANENQLSEVLTELLDPQGHTDKAQFFCNRLFADWAARLTAALKNYREARTIYITKSKRRIDLMIDGGDWGIAIENKS